MQVFARVRRGPPHTDSGIAFKRRRTEEGKNCIMKGKTQERWRALTFQQTGWPRK